MCVCALRFFEQELLASHAAQACQGAHELTHPASGKSVFVQPVHDTDAWLQLPVKHCVWATGHGCNSASSLCHHQHTRSTIPGLQTELPEAITDTCAAQVQDPDYPQITLSRRSWCKLQEQLRFVYS